MRDPIYKPTGAALEYADYALNIYTGCPLGSRSAGCMFPAMSPLRAYGDEVSAEFRAESKPAKGDGKMITFILGVIIGTIVTFLGMWFLAGCLAKSFEGFDPPEE